MSGYTEHPVLTDAGAETGIAFLQKPFTRSVLLRKVRDVLDAPRG